MNNSKLSLLALLDAVGVLIYTSAVGGLMYNSDHLFGQTRTALGPIAILLLLVLSVSVVGVLIFGRPVYLYMEGQKSSGVKLMLYTIGWLIIITILALIVLASWR